MLVEFLFLEDLSEDGLQDIGEGFDLRVGIHGRKADAQSVSSRAERLMCDGRAVQSCSRANAVVGKLFGNERGSDPFKSKQKEGALLRFRQVDFDTGNCLERLFCVMK